MAAVSVKGLLIAVSPQNPKRRRLLLVNGEAIPKNCSRKTIFLNICLGVQE